MLRYPSLQFAGIVRTGKEPSLMNGQIPKVNDIYSAIDARDKTTDPKRAERIELIYLLASRGARRSLNALMNALCDKSLKELLKKPDKQKKPQS
jgi:hypothetical protein